jgi:hypothetical protein
LKQSNLAVLIHPSSFILHPSDMVVRAADYWSELLQRTLAVYGESLLRQVAAKLVRPRSHWPAAELIAKSVATVANPAVVDRRIKELDLAARQLLALIGHSRQPVWSLGNLVELAIALGHADGLKPVFDLLSAGLLYPYFNPPPSEKALRLQTFEQWLGFAGPTGLTVFTLPSIANRAIGENLPLPTLSSIDGSGPSASRHPPATMEADGLEIPLRLSVLWQQVAAAPLRRTQNGGYFKRDTERLGADKLLNSPPADSLTEVPGFGFLLAALAELEGMLEEGDGELRAASLPPWWEDAGLSGALESLYAALPGMQTWNALEGWRGPESAMGNPFPSAVLLGLVLLARVPDGTWLRPALIEEWLRTHHPYWTGEALRPSRLQPWFETFLLGIAYQMRLVQARRDEDGWLVRLSPAGRWLLGLGDAPLLDSGYQQTLMVQPNLEIVAYRQGLSPSLIGKLTRFAAWTNLGAACTLQLEPATVYRALESGLTFETIRLTLEQHGVRALPPAVLESLKTWANKRDRITVYPSAVLMEFTTADDLNEALARGLPGVRIADTLAIVVNEEAIDFKHFRLTGTRDYGLPPERCVSVEPDGVTLVVDLARSDLLLETEAPHFAELLTRTSPNGRRHYRLTPASLAAARDNGWSLAMLEQWFVQRTGRSLPAAARLLMVGGEMDAPRLQRHLVLHVAAPELADGLMQWPETRPLIEARLGPTALAVAEKNVTMLRERLKAVGVRIAD